MSEEKRMLGNYEVTQSIYVGDKEVVLAVDKKEQYPFLVCYCDYHNPLSAAWATEGVASDDYLEADGDTIPTGHKLSLAGTRLDLRKPIFLQGLEADHTFLLPRDNRFHTVGQIQDPGSGRWIELSTDLPSVQVYTGDHLPQGMRGKSGAIYGPRSGVCLEPQFFPDSPNHTDFPNTLLRKGCKSRHRTDMEKSP